MTLLGPAFARPGTSLFFGIVRVPLRSPIWRNRDFVRLWAAGTVSIFGTLVTRTALPFTAILVLGAGPIEVATLRSLEYIAGLVVGLFAGAWVDRLRRRPLMIGADLGRAALLATIPLAAVISALTLGQLFVVAFLAAALTTVFDVADRSLLPTVIGRDEVLDANSALTASSAAAEFSAFGVGGFLVQALTAPIAILVDAVTFLISAVFIGRIRAPEPPPAPRADDASVRREIVEGLRLVLGHPVLRPIAFAGAAVEALFGVFGATYLLFANQVLGFSPAIIGLIAAVGGLTSFIGAVLAGRATRRFGVGPVLIGAMLLVSIGNAFIPLAPGATIIGAACLVAQQIICDSALTVFDIDDVSLRQTLMSDRQLGRVNGSIRVLGVAATLMGTILGGILAELIDIRFALIVGATGGLVGALILWLSPVRSMRQMPEPVAGSAAGGAAVVPGQDLPLSE
jgi:MFS family permease